VALIAFCRYWGMTPREVDALTPAEYQEMTRYAVTQQAAERRAQRRRRG